MFEIEVTKKVKVQVETLAAYCDVRYWEDATVNGDTDDDGDLIPCRIGDAWCPVIDLKTGVIEDWPEGTEANVHYKVCDAGIYKLIDPEGDIVAQIDGYVPEIMYPGGHGYGDYIIMKINGKGQIENWRVDLEAFVPAGYLECRSQCW